MRVFAAEIEPGDVILSGATFPTPGNLTDVRLRRDVRVRRVDRNGDGPRDVAIRVDGLTLLAHPGRVIRVA